MKSTKKNKGKQRDSSNSSKQDQETAKGKDCRCYISIYDPMAQDSNEHKIEPYVDDNSDDDFQPAIKFRKRRSKSDWRT